MAYIGVSPSNGVRRKHTYTATASQTTFSGAGSEGVSLSYRDSNYVDVYVNGVKLGDADYTATSGTSIVLGVGAAVNDIVEIITYDVFSVADTVSKADGGTFDGNVAMAGTLGVTGDLTVDTNTLYVDSANNRVGVGTVSPDVPVEISVAGNSITNVLKLTTTSSGTVPALQFEGDASGTQHIIARVRAQQDDASNGGIVFETENSGTVAERMRIDSSGNLLVGKTSADSGATVGVELNTNDTAYFTRSGGAGVNINRTSTDGNIAVLQKDGTTIGVLGVNGGNNLFISSAIANHGGLIFSDGGASTPQMNPISSGSTLVDNAMNIGSASYRFKDLYLSSQAITSNTGTAAAPNFAISSGALGNNGMFCPAANTIAFSNAATERMRIHSGGNVTIGTTNQSPAESSTATGTRIGSTGKTQMSSSGAETLMLNRNTSDGTLINFRRAGAEVGAIQSFSGCLAIGSYVGNDSFIRFGNSDVRPVNSSGTDRDNGIDLGSTTARFKNLYLSGGAYIGGTGSANYLDDYEEGTFTVTLGGATFSVTNTTGYYTKIGRQVFFNWYSSAMTVSSASGQANFTGLPFTASNGSEQYGIFLYVHGNAITGSKGGYIVKNTGKGIWVVDDSVADETFVNGSSKYLMISGHYQTDS